VPLLLWLTLSPVLPWSGLLAQYNEWERNTRRLSEELRQYRTYASILRGPSEPGSPRTNGQMTESLQTV